MAYKITNECVSCGLCAGNCSEDAISQGADHYEIDAAKCKNCGDCAGDCPMDAIVEE